MRFRKTGISQHNNGGILDIQLPRLVARIPASIYAKLLVAFLMIVVLLVTVGVVGLQVLGEANRRDQDIVALQRKIAAYRQLQQETTSQLYSVALAVLSPEESRLETTLRQFNQFSYNVDRLEFVAQDEVELLSLIKSDHDQFREVVTEVIELARAGKITEAQDLQLVTATPLADDLERHTNQLVNKAEADMVAAINLTQQAYRASQWLVIGFAVGSIVLAVVLGYAITGSLLVPIRQMDTRLERIAHGDFSQHVKAANRDELGTLATNLNRMNDELGRLYRELQTRNQELTAALDENVRLVHELEQKSQQLETVSHHKSAFLANMSHELRTPLNAIIGFSEVLLEKMFGELNPKQNDYLQDILDSGRHLLELINDILDISKVEAGRMELERTNFLLPDLLQNGLRLFREQAIRHNIDLNLTLDPTLGHIHADERMVKQVIMNLLSNAVKFTPEGGRIDVRAQVKDDEVLVGVQDTGIGITPDDQALIFGEFQQARHGTMKSKEGTGLGLALAKKFVELHGGRIWVDSEVGVGTTFTFTLPIKHPINIDVPTEALTPETTQPTILLVEDDVRVIDLLKLYLGTTAFKVHIAHNGEEGLVMAQRLRPVAIILDILLPTMGGWDFLVQAKADPTTRDIPVIIISSLDEKGKGFALGAAEYLVKPVNREVLLAALGRFAPARMLIDKHAKVLVIDDDHVAIELVKAILQPEGYTVLEATNGQEGVTLARQELPQLIILDLLMPGIDGFSVVEQLHSDPLTATIAILILTSKSMTLEDKARLNGQIGYLAHKAEFNRAAFVGLVQTLSKMETM